MVSRSTSRSWLRHLAPIGLLAGMATLGASSAPPQEPLRTQTPPAFRSGVDFVPVSVTVTDRSGRFVADLRQTNFRVFEDGREQPIVHFAADRVPISLGLALDTSDSMRGTKLAEAQAALGRFLGDLLGPDDEICLYRFADRPALVQSWTTDRSQLRRSLGEVRAGGATALIDTVAEALPMVQTGQRMKRVLVLISDGRDTASVTHPDHLASLIRETDVLIYAIGIDGRARPVLQPSAGKTPPRYPIPRPFPTPRGGGRGPIGRGSGGTGGWSGAGGAPPPSGDPGATPPDPGPGQVVVMRNDDRVDAGALRELTDTSGGRTEIVRSTSDLGPATAGIADELNRQYLIGYQATAPRDGRWHDIRVEVRGRWGVTVRARKGYLAPR